jgi:hypothetical protein
LSLTAFAVATLTIAILLVTGTNARQVSAASPATGPFPTDFTGIGAVAASPAPVPGPGASTGTVTEDCGVDAENHHNADNLVVSPGLTNGAHHTHDYVGNLSTTAFSTNASLAAAPTTCTDGDKSTYFWPVLRRQDQPGTDPHAVGGGHDGNLGRILPPASVTVQFQGNPAGAVVPMPRFLRMITGDPVAATVGLAQAHAQWGCSGFADRHTMLYPRCPSGQRLTRTFDFPSCWNGLDTDSENHRTHVLFPAADGVCPPATFPVPRLHVVVAYDVRPGTPIAVDAFPEQKHSPVTDHSGFVDVMTDHRMTAVVACLNSGRRC